MADKLKIDSGSDSDEDAESCSGNFLGSEVEKHDFLKVVHMGLR